MNRNPLAERVVLASTPNGGEVVLWKGFLDKATADDLFQFAGKQTKVKYPFGMKLNRPISACGDAGTFHEFRGVQVKIHPWSDAAAAARELLARELGVSFNFCLLNNYPDGKHGLLPHVDSELYASNKSVATLSTGATRTMQLVPILKTTEDDRETMNFEVAHGDLFLMQGDIQCFWKHGIKPETWSKERNSFTFRSTLLKHKKRKTAQTCKHNTKQLKKLKHKNKKKLGASIKLVMTLYTSASNATGTRNLLRVNPQTGAVLFDYGVPIFGTTRSLFMAIDPLLNNLYAIQQNNTLYLVNQTTGQALAPIGAANSAINGMTFLGSSLFVLRYYNPGSGAGLYLGNIDTGTGVFSPTAQISATDVPITSQICFAASPFGVLYLLVRDVLNISNLLYTVSSTTAVLTFVTNLNSLFPTVPLFRNMAFDASGQLYLVTDDVVTGLTTQLTAIQNSSIGWQITVPAVIIGASFSGIFISLAFSPPACVHHTSLVELADGTRLPISEIQPGMILRQGDGATAEVDSLVECDLKEHTSDQEHLCLVFEPSSLGPNIPNARFAVDPGHPISLPSAYTKDGPHALRCARAFATELPSSQFQLCTWTKVHDILGESQTPRRFDIILKEGRSTYLANGVAVLSRTSLRKPGYDHAGGLF